jgi:Putative glycerate kinase
MLRDVAMELIWAALGAVNPVRAVARHLRWEPPTLFVGDCPYDLSRIDRVIVIGAGKAGAGMASAVEALLSERVATGWVNVRYGYEPAQPLARIHIHPAGHPIPDEASLGGTRRMLALVDSLTPRDLAMVLISGGASALMEAPVPGVSLGRPPGPHR